MTRPSSRPVAGLRVLEISAGSHAVAYCGRLLASMGAEVVALVPSVAHSVGREGSPDSVSRDSDGAAVLYESVGKRRTAMPAGDADQPSAVARLLAGSDILIEGLAPAQRSRLRLDPDALATTGVIHVSITPFGAHGSWSGLRATPFIVAHSAGEARLNPGGIDRLDHAPEVLPGHVLEYDAGGVAGCIVLAGLIEGQRGYRYCDLSVHDVAVSMMRAEIASGLATGVEHDRSTRASELGGTLPCLDGWLDVAIREDWQWDHLVALMGRPAWSSDGRYASREGRAEDGFRLTGLIAEWLRSQSRGDVVLAARHLGVPLTPVLGLDEVLTLPAHARRRFFVASPAAPAIVLPRGVPLVFSGFGGIGENETLSGASSDPPRRRASPARSARVPAGRRSQPLAGLKVIELATVWAAPSAAMYLRLLGADVVKVESRRRLDLTRRIERDPKQVSFHLANSGKRSVLADLDTAAGQSVVRALATTADVVISTEDLTRMGRRGLGYQDLARLRPELVWVQVSTLGADDPDHVRGYASSFAALSGVAALNGYPDGGPANIGNAADFRVSYDALLGALAGILAARRSGAGGIVDVSCVEAMTLRIGDLLVAHQWGSTDLRSRHRRSRLAALSADGEWVALDLENESDHAGLLRLLGCASDEGALEHMLSDWVSVRRGEDAAAQLRQAGFAATVSLSNIALGRLRHLHERRLVRRVTLDGRDGSDGSTALLGVPWHSPASRWESITWGSEGPLARGPGLGENPETLP